MVVARPQADSPEDQREAAGGRTPEERPAKGTVCEVAELPAWLREDSPEARGAWWAKLAAAANMRPSEITGT